MTMNSIKCIEKNKIKLKYNYDYYIKYTSIINFGIINEISKIEKQVSKKNQFMIIIIVKFLILLLNNLTKFFIQVITDLINSKSLLRRNILMY